MRKFTIEIGGCNTEAKLRTPECSDDCKICALTWDNGTWMDVQEAVALVGACIQTLLDAGPKAEK